MKSGRTPYSVYSVPLVLAALLAVLASLQYQWIGQVSQAEHDRMQAGLRVAVRHMADDLDGELLRAFLHFQTRSGASRAETELELSERFARWQAEARYPELVQEIYSLERRGGGRGGLRRLDPAESRFEAVAVPGQLAAVRLRARQWRPAAGGFGARGFGPGAGRPGQALVAEVPALLIPLRGSGRGAPASFAIIRLDLSFITKSLLGDLAELHFGTASELDYELSITLRKEPGTVLWSSPPGMAVGSLEGGDITVGLFALRGLQRARNLGLGTADDLGGPLPERPPTLDRSPPPTPLDNETLVGAWQLTARHRAGSLEKAVAGARRRNLGVSLAILVLLASTLATLWISARKAQALARRQLEFVAAVSHELRTPLAAIRSAGQNLADGIVTDPKQVARYGGIVETEGRRLTGMVENILGFAGLQWDSRSLTLEEVTIDDLIDEALAGSRHLIEEAGVRVERNVAHGLPCLHVDREALRKVLLNLIENAVKYGGEARWVGLRAAAAGAEVVITVEDRGPGIPGQDLAHIFEPFYRGQRHASRRVSGSGLGLSLARRIVDAHGGRLTVRTGSEGSEFTIRLGVGRMSRTSSPSTSA